MLAPRPALVRCVHAVVWGAGRWRSAGVCVVVSSVVALGRGHRCGAGVAVVSVAAVRDRVGSALGVFRVAVHEIHIVRVRRHSICCV